MLFGSSQRDGQPYFFYKAGIAVPFLFFLGFNAIAQKTWLPITGGDWTSGANWSGGVAPIAGDEGQKKMALIKVNEKGKFAN